MTKALERQGAHLLGYLLIGGALGATASLLPESERRLWGWSAFEWVVASWVLAFLHQSWIAFFWRSELHFGKISAWMGATGFSIYRMGFVLFGVSRLFMVVPISLATIGSAAIPRPISAGLIIATTPLILWGLYSVLFYLGVTRAFGADHFDPAYRSAGLETRGTFKYFPNTAYTVVLLALYHPGLLWHSRLGLIAAAAHHALVWCHYFCTEKPDMRVIYGDRDEPKTSQRFTS